ncbi:MAG: hypothetical protein A2915_00460 [Candidatus Yanofskybacteria bacterium RIFCSPLOWO2_01_FULL_41_34]|uniref:Uncharacterized protein n=1 Tax=Candidatus Yanofskybacteria bacterium RIFCSPHIGHO2_01_FULL_41_26 TaxID=1802661 RepID=A0A1F8EBY9_9BACT|nr:MAG: hypothetical protein A2649_02495 [Candidatus Yanofskybacteria bacterium RIFCSPHIGHO2_01_FULL_41_26]OGN22371.1 MAG: hypothetical protein A2915_00460 [Candidatus Yanofskybacteria bacterium RIFCSPLOWO2_01_FULL_41_34]
MSIENPTIVQESVEQKDAREFKEGNEAIAESIAKLEARVKELKELSQAVSGIKKEDVGAIKFSGVILKEVAKIIDNDQVYSANESLREVAKLTQTEK